MLGVGLWTKPTMGAFVWGIGLLCVIELVRVRFDLRAAWERWQLALLAFLAAMPLGGVWYIRNFLLGHVPKSAAPVLADAGSARRIRIWLAAAGAVGISHICLVLRPALVAADSARISTALACYPPFSIRTGLFSGWRWQWRCAFVRRAFPPCAGSLGC
jgi:hypothetical protein